QRLVLIPKGNKPPGDASSYRPLCMIDAMGKILEKIIARRLCSFIDDVGGLSDNQYGFRKNRSTVDAIRRVRDIAQEAIAGERWRGGQKKYCGIITLDIKNAFNSVSWHHIMQALRNLETPQFLTGIIRSYLQNRTLMYDTEKGRKQYV
ncbi:hypothetical protein KR222_011828, partial [Zaprionus bogoriensis]